MALTYFQFGPYHVGSAEVGRHDGGMKSFIRLNDLLDILGLSLDRPILLSLTTLILRPHGRFSLLPVSCV